MGEKGKGERYGKNRVMGCWNCLIEEPRESRRVNIRVKRVESDSAH